LGAYIGIYMKWVFVGVGVILILFGLHVAHVFHIPFLAGRFGGIEKAKDPSDLVGAFFVGVAFAVGWSPCTGPIMAAILALAGSQGTVLAGGLLLLAYCIGLGLPFILTGLAVEYFLEFFKKLHWHLRKIEIASAVLLIALGVLFITQNLDFLRGHLGLNATGFELNHKENIAGGLNFLAIGTAMFAGFLSFVSPCVLPLLPSYIAFIAGTSEIDEVTGKGESD